MRRRAIFEIVGTKFSAIDMKFSAVQKNAVRLEALCNGCRGHVKSKLEISAAQ